jgi:hypothetical protein
MSDFVPDCPAPLTEALAFWRGQSRDRPSAVDLVTALQGLEKQRLTKGSTYTNLIGTWQLAFITGTQTAQQQAGSVLNAGRFVPKWITIQITYSTDLEELLPNLEPQTLSGAVENRVQLGALDLVVVGPVTFYRDRQILAFDFTRLNLKVLQRSLYQGFIRGGRDRESQFLLRTLKEQAFFKYFWITPDSIAARGRGGGLALWIRG